MFGTGIGKGEINSDIVNLQIIWARLADNKTSENTWNMKTHHHAFYEIHFVLQGEATIKVDDNHIHLMTENLLIVPPKRDHAFLALTEDYREFVAGFYMDFSTVHPDSQYLAKAVSVLENARPISASAQCMYYIRDCLRCIQERPYFSSVLVMNIYLLMLEISRQIVGDRTLEGTVADSDQIMEEIRYYILSNISEGITTEDVASYMNISSRHLNRLLKKEMQISVNGIILKEKMNCIRRLLSSTDMTLEQIAEMAGFTNAYNMSRAFKKQEGMSPGEYRKALRKK